jgi:hypothetical protein
MDDENIAVPCLILELQRGLKNEEACGINASSFA